MILKRFLIPLKQEYFIKIRKDIYLYSDRTFIINLKFLKKINSKKKSVSCIPTDWNSDVTYHAIRLGYCSIILRITNPL